MQIVRALLTDDAIDQISEAYNSGDPFEVLLAIENLGRPSRAARQSSARQSWLTLEWEKGELKDFKLEIKKALKGRTVAGMSDLDDADVRAKIELSVIRAQPDVFTSAASGLNIAGTEDIYFYWQILEQEDLK